MKLQLKRVQLLHLKPLTSKPSSQLLTWWFKTETLNSWHAFVYSLIVVDIFSIIIVDHLFIDYNNVTVYHFDYRMRWTALPSVI